MDGGQVDVNAAVRRSVHVPFADAIGNDNNIVPTITVIRKPNAIILVVVR